MQLFQRRHHAANCAGVEPHQLALVATHGWDIHGAVSTGPMTVFVSRGKPYSNFMSPPDMITMNLRDAVELLVRLND